ncbi:MAG: tRNA 2-thiouridine(34) synthase MnmA [Patescibacteria group bacterium]
MERNKRIKVAVGVSGGVDSSVSAYLLKEQGYDVTGVYMQCWDSKLDGCTAEADRSDAVKVCAKLGIKFESLDFIKDYKTKVIEYFFSEYEKGRTPNPDVICNKEIKFGMFLDWALRNGFSLIATGHYARTQEQDGQVKLLKGVDVSKDQSYFLYALNQIQLSKVLFPVGGMKKTAVREIAKKVGLHTASKPDSVGICFIGEVDIKKFLEKRLEIKKGNVVNKKGEVIGEHDGIWFYTIGQRHGFRLSTYVGMPLYVVDKNVEKNELIVGFAGDVLKKSFETESPHWIGDPPSFPLDCEVRVRHLGELHKCTLDENKVTLVDPIFGIAPGQSAVFYDGDRTLGGGIIE